MERTARQESYQSFEELRSAVVGLVLAAEANLKDKFGTESGEIKLRDDEHQEGGAARMIRAKMKHTQRDGVDMLELRQLVWNNTSSTEISVQFDLLDGSIIAQREDNEPDATFARKSRYHSADPDDAHILREILNDILSRAELVVGEAVTQADIENVCSDLLLLPSRQPELVRG